MRMIEDDDVKKLARRLIADGERFKMARWNEEMCMLHDPGKCRASVEFTIACSECKKELTVGFDMDCNAHGWNDLSNVFEMKIVDDEGWHIRRWGYQCPVCDAKIAEIAKMVRAADDECDLDHRIDTLEDELRALRSRRSMD